MSDFESALLDEMREAESDFIYLEEATPAEADAYRAGSRHAITAASNLFEVFLARRLEDAAYPGVADVHEAVRTCFAIEWEQGKRPSGDLRVLDEVLACAATIIESSQDCE